MIHNIIIGDSHDKNYDWSLNNKGYIECPTIHQSIKVENEMMSTFKITKSGNQATHIGNFEIPNCRYVCNNRTMNPILMSTNRDVDDSDNMIIFLIIEKDYRMASYNIRNRIKILRRFSVVESKKLNAVGCTIVCSKNDILSKIEDPIITVNLLNTITDTVSTCEIRYDFDRGCPILNWTNHTDDKINESVREIIAKQKRPIGFKIHTLPNQQLTCTMMFPTSKKEVAETVSSHLKNRIMIEIPDEDLNNIDAMSKIIDSHDLQGAHIRALTMIGMDLPRELINKYKFIYLFQYNESNHLLDMVK